jgi:hypothetical protein
MKMKMNKINLYYNPNKSYTFATELESISMQNNTNKEMKKVLLFSVMLLFVASASQAQHIFSKGDKVVNVGVGLGTYIGGTGYSTVIPPISASFEYGIKDDLFNSEKASLGVGAYLAYMSQKYKFPGSNYGYDFSYAIVGARGIIHYQLLDKLDTYGGAMLGYNVASSEWFSDDSSVSVPAPSAGGFTFSLFIGGRYYFTDKFAAFLELGYGIAPAELGVAFKF